MEAEKVLKQLLHEREIIGYSIEKDGSIIIMTKKDMPKLQELGKVKIILLKDDIKALQ